MRIGIVGAEGAKFTHEGEVACRKLIREIVADLDVTEVVSGECHLGGVDIWAREETLALGKAFTGYAPKELKWETGYKPRNLRIAYVSEVVHCITVNKLPKGFKGMTFEMCYHCGTSSHVKSGGCWTAKKAKKGVWHVIEQ